MLVEAELSAGDRLPSEAGTLREAGGEPSVDEAIVALEVQGILKLEHGRNLPCVARAWRDSANSATSGSQAEASRHSGCPEAIEVKLAEGSPQSAVRSWTSRCYLQRSSRCSRKLTAARRRAGRPRLPPERCPGSAFRSPGAHVHPAPRGHRGLPATETADQIGTPETLLEQDRRIGNAIAAGQGVAAAAAMKDHLKTTAHLKLLAWSPLSDSPFAVCLTQAICAENRRISGACGAQSPPLLSTSLLHQGNEIGWTPRRKGRQVAPWSRARRGWR